MEASRRLSDRAGGPNWLPFQAAPSGHSAVRALRAGACDERTHRGRRTGANEHAAPRRRRRGQDSAVGTANHGTTARARLAALPRVDVLVGFADDLVARYGR